MPNKKLKDQLEAESRKLIEAYTPTLVALQVALERLNHEEPGAPTLDGMLHLVERRALECALHFRRVRRHRRRLIEAQLAEWREREGRPTDAA